MYWRLILVLTLVLPCQATSKRNKAKGEVSTLAMAAKQFYVDYGKLPNSGVTSGIPNDSKPMIRALIAANPVVNPRRTVYVETEGGLLDGTFLDPWKTQYRIHLDENYDGKITLLGATIVSAAVAQSAGEDCIFDTMDDIFSFKASSLSLKPVPVSHRMSKRLRHFMPLALVLLAGGVLLGVIICVVQRRGWIPALLILGIIIVILAIVLPLRPTLI